MSADVVIGQLTGPRFTRITGLGSYRPQRVVTNADLEKIVETNDEWIRSRVGIAERHFADDTESVAFMGAEAGRLAIQDAGMTSADIDTVIVATCTLPAQIPHASTQVAYRLGIEAPGSFDINAACAGFCYGLATASALIRAGDAKRVLMVGAEKLTDWVDPVDRANAIIFADGAGAVVVSGSQTPEIGPVSWGCSIENTETIYIKDRDSFIYQEGQTVFRWATSAIAPVAIDAAAKAGVTLSDIDVLAPHQANLRIVDAIAKRVKAAGAREDLHVVRDIVTTGNTSSASIPIGLDRARAAGEVHSGDLVLAVGYGAGLTYGSQVFRLP